VLYVDDVTLAYHSLLPMDVHGTQYSKLRFVTEHSNLPLHTVSIVHTVCHVKQPGLHLGIITLGTHT